MTRTIFLLALSLTTQLAQASSSPQLGTVLGRVFCADTNRPARMARVMLEPAEDVQKSLQTPRTFNFTTVNSVQTSLDGSFVITNVKPGSYYAIADLDGYVSSLADRASEGPTPKPAEATKPAENELQNVVVEAGRKTSVNITLNRGAAVSGTVSFDDGSPVPGASVRALRRNPSGAWIAEESPAFIRIFDEIKTSDLGQYRIASLSPGTYLLKVTLSLVDIAITSDSPQSSSSAEDEKYSLSFFTGGYLKANADSAFALTAGEFRGGEDLVIPLAKLHSVSGTVVAARDGHPVSSATVRLFGDDGKVQITSAKVSAENGEFHFYFVPEGSFKIKVDDAGDYSPASRVITHSYGPLSQPIEITADGGDTENLTLSVPDLGAVSAQ